jgi:4-diphosphocytidyl-2-C-methyl-D-erythritol kinase
MAGGSTDCAAALVGASKLFNLNLSKQKLMEMGVKLGADVPYCVLRGTALSEGIGEVLTPLPPIPDCNILIVKPPISVSTKFVYQHLDAAGLDKHPDIDGMVNAIKTGSLTGITDRVENVLETVTVPKYPVIEEIKNCMKENGAMNALMSGSGPTVFGIFGAKDKDAAQQAKKMIQDKGLANQIYIVQPFNQDI